MFHLFRKRIPDHLKTGLWGEKIAERVLKKTGLRLIDRRVRVGRRDELDLVMRDGETLVFVEVKTRGSEAFGRPIAAVDRNKQRTLSRAAVRYVKQLKVRPAQVRFDVVEVIGSPGMKDPEVRHVQSAFSLSEPYRLQW